MIKNYVTHIQTHEKLCITKECVLTLDVANISKPINYISCYSCQLLGKKLCFNKCFRNITTCINIQFHICQSS